jgi:hypothetical protein
MSLPTLTLYGARLTHGFQFAFEPGDPFLHAAAINLQLRLPRPARADPASLTRQVMPHPRETRQEVLQLGQLDLQSAFPTACPLRKNIEN